MSIRSNLFNTEVERLKTELATLPSSAPLTKVVSVLRDKNLYEVFVVEDSKLGMVSIRDILRAKHVHARKASSLVIQMPALAPRSDVTEAARLMNEYRSRSLPIIDKGKPVGMVTEPSICKWLNTAGTLDFSVDRIMTGHPVTLNVSDVLAKAKKIMVQRNIDHLPVLQNGKTCGLLTSQQLLDAIVPPERITRESMTPEKRKVSRLSVQGLMDPRPLTCTPSEKASKVLNKMIDQNRTYTLIVFGEELQGILTYRDFVKLLAKPEEKRVPVYMVGLPDAPFEAEAARDKFVRIIELLRRGIPDIMEARCTIKTSTPVKKKGRKRYEVKTMIYTPTRTFTHSESGWELPSVFDSLADKLKKIMSRREKGKRRGRRRS